MARQQWLIPYQNPLKKRLGDLFFKSIPTTPGVYLMRGRDDALLYVGKAKNLRNRINSYKNATPKQVSRKVIRLVNLVRRIEWEECPSEQDALLRENAMLRDFKPPFNVVNTRPDTYYYIGVNVITTQLHFTLTTRPADQINVDCLFGAYKGRARTREGYGALLRLLWACQMRPSMTGRYWNFSYPGTLVKKTPAYSFHLSVHGARAFEDTKDLMEMIKKFLKGQSSRLMPYLSEKILTNTTIPKFYYKLIQEDLEALQEFYEFGPKRNHKLRRQLKIKKHLILQEQMDDYLVMGMFQ